CEVDPIKAADAAMHGFRVMPLLEAMADADIVLTVTGVRHALGPAHFEAGKDGVLLANGGHFRNEIDVEGLAALAKDSVAARDTVTTYTLPDGRRINLLGDGNIVNIACGDGHPAEIMDTSFALQALSARHLATAGDALAAGAYEVPAAIDAEVARLKLAAMGVAIDSLTPEQSEYMAGWEV
ncbi:MAG: adenosylhomocysteinase, partial [Gammaproteobacteria bacterium]|nr:adenosylhomocysteinase [Gammaproteobacteria bacterium]